MIKRPPLRIFQSVVFALVLREMRTRFGSHRLGAFWVFFEPIAQLLVWLLVITEIKGRFIFGYDFSVYILTGIFAFDLFRDVSLRIMNSIRANSSLFNYRQIKPADTFVARLIVEVSIGFIVYLCIFGAMRWFGWSVPFDKPLEWLTAIFAGVAVGFGFGIIFVFVTHAVPELELVIKLIYLPLYLLSGVLFSVTVLPSAFLPWLLLNPMLHVVELQRAAMFPNYRPIDGTSLQYVLWFGFVSIFIGMALYRMFYRQLLKDQ